MIARLATRQHGVVARWQLLAAGIGREAIAHRLRTGRLHRLSAGVYAVGHRAITRYARLTAGVLASGPEATVAGGTASALWELRDAYPAVIELIAPTARRPLPGLHRRRIVLPQDERTTRYDIPVTTVARTILDRAATLDRSALEREMEQAEAHEYADASGLGELIDRYPRAPGRATLVAIRAAETIASGATKGELDKRFLAILSPTAIPLPARNRHVAGYEVDGVWPAARLVLELDSRRFHGTGAAFDRDRRKWRRLQAAGWRVIVVTWRHLDAPAEPLADLRTLLGMRPS